MRRLILFDIDGTLLTTDGAAWTAFRRALVETYGTAGPIEDYDFAGRTDTGIARDLLTAAGLTTDEIDRGAAEFWRRYPDHLERELRRHPDRTRLMPGVPAILDALDRRHADTAVVGLLTGNIEHGARLKLSAAGLDGRFAFGAYGSDHQRRDRLPAIAVRRAQAHCGREFAGPEIVIIGDTPHDVTCGRALGVRAVAVATGRHDAATLTTAGAHRVFQDLSDTDTVIDALLHD